VEKKKRKKNAITDKIQVPTSRADEPRMLGKDEGKIPETTEYQPWLVKMQSLVEMQEHARVIDSTELSSARASSE